MLSENCPFSRKAIIMRFLTQISMNPCLINPGGGHWPRKGVWGCATVMTPFFQATRRSLAYQRTIIAPLLCPPFSNFRKIFHFQPCFGQNFSSQDANFPNFRSLDPALDPSFFKENSLPRPYFWKPVWHTPTKKKVKCPPPPPPPRESTKTMHIPCFYSHAWLQGSLLYLYSVSSVVELHCAGNQCLQR